MPLPIRSIVAMAPVASVTASIAFYRRLGFRVDNSFTPPGAGEPTWAWLHGGGGALMVTSVAGGPPGTGARVVFYLYVDDTAQKHGELVAAGVAAGPIERPFYAPQGEFRVVDPDGHELVFSHPD